MVTVYFSDTDDAGHRYGPDSGEIAAAVASVDASLGRLLAGIAALPHGEQVYVVLVSDHGMLRAAADRADVLDPSLFPGVRFITGGPYASLVVDEGGPERAAQVRDSIQEMLPAHGVYLREDVPARLHYSADPRIGDIVVVAPAERTVVAPAGGTVVTPGSVPEHDSYTHGWDNAVDEMGAIFLAMGPGIAGGQRIEGFESIHVYPFVTHVLGLQPNPDVDGRLEVLAPILGG
jgi:predicted AlkP superfamily pyrophosphatase or phosphodiesterase